MKFLIALLFIAVSLFSQKAKAQTYCGIAYSYDNAGNRIERALNSCDMGGESYKVPDSTSMVRDSSLAVSVYPNPTFGNFNVVLSSVINTGQLIITDNLGRQLYKATISGIMVPLNISNLESGIYYITVRAEGNSYQSSIVKN